jgi:hypothetical protein
MILTSIHTERAVTVFPGGSKNVVNETLRAVDEQKWILFVLPNRYRKQLCQIDDSG